MLVSSSMRLAGRQVLSGSIRTTTATTNSSLHAVTSKRGFSFSGFASSAVRQQSSTSSKAGQLAMASTALLLTAAALQEREVRVVYYHVVAFFIPIPGGRRNKKCSRWWWWFVYVSCNTRQSKKRSKKSSLSSVFLNPLARWAHKLLHTLVYTHDRTKKRLKTCLENPPSNLSRKRKINLERIGHATS